MELLVAYDHDRALRRERVYKDHLDPLDISDEQLLKNYRFPRCEIINLIENLDPLLKRNTQRSHALQTSTQVLVALRFYASGTFQNVIADTAGLTQASVSRIISNITEILAEKSKNEIKMPTTGSEINRTIQNFGQINGFPRVIGALDGTHIAIKAPADDEPIYVNRKNFHSLNMQVISNADNLVLSYSVRYPGSTHDAFIWGNSAIKRRFQNGDFGDAILLGKYFHIVFYDKKNHIPKLHFYHSLFFVSA